MLTLLATTLFAMHPEGWKPCLYNNKSIECKRTFLCTEAPCFTFKLEWADGLSDIYKGKPGMARNTGIYYDTRGGEWLLRGYAGSFGLKNDANGNTIIFDMKLEDCKNSGLSDLCQ